MEKEIENERKGEKDFCRIRKVLKSKINSGNSVKAIYLRAVALTRYDARLTINRKTRVRLTMHRTLQLQTDFDKLYLPRDHGGGGMVSVEDFVEMETEPKEVCRKQQ